MRLLIVRMSMPGERRNLPLERWLRAREGEGHVLREAGYSERIDVKRCRELQRFLDSDPSCDAILMVDSDMVPLDTSKAIVGKDGPDVGWCQAVTRQGGLSHTVDGSCSCAMLRISRRAAERIQKPFFRFTTDEANAKTVRCECDWFAGQARAAGFHPVKVGTAGHLITVMAFPTETGIGFMYEHETDAAILPGLSPSLPSAGSPERASESETQHPQQRPAQG